MIDHVQSNQSLFDNPKGTRGLLNIVKEAWLSVLSLKMNFDGEDVLVFDKVNAQAIGSLLEHAVCTLLSRKLPHLFRAGTSAKTEKDIVHKTRNSLSFEIKTSGQAGFKIFGNRSTGNSQLANDRVKIRSGIYLVINYTGRVLSLVSVALIDDDQWRGQKAASGQSATLSAEVYRTRFFEVCDQVQDPIDDYRMLAPLFMLKGFTKKTKWVGDEIGQMSIRDFLKHAPRSGEARKFRHIRRDLRKQEVIMRSVG